MPPRVFPMFAWGSAFAVFYVDHSNFRELQIMALCQGVTTIIILCNHRGGKPSLTVHVP